MNEYNVNEYDTPGVKPLYRGTQVIWYLLGFLEILLAFRLILRALAANPTAWFSQIIYTLTYPFVAPFNAVFGTSQVQGSVFEWTTVLAMAVYGFIGWGIVQLLVMGKPVSRTEAAIKLDRQGHS